MPKQRSKRHTRNNKKNNKNITNGTVLPYRGAATIVPDKTRTVLQFWDSNTFDLSSSTPVPSVRYQPSAAFDIDPDLGGTAMPGFAALANFYSTYRVLGSRIKVEAASHSSLTGELIVIPLNQDPGVSPTSNFVVAAKSQPFAKSKMVGTIGGPVASLTNSMTTKKLYGSATTLFDDKFSSVVNTIPENNWWWMVALYTKATTATTFTVNVTIDVDVEFYDRRFLAV